MTPPPPGPAIKFAGESTVAVLLLAADAILASLSRDEATLAPVQAKKEKEIAVMRQSIDFLLLVVITITGSNESFS